LDIFKFFIEDIYKTDVKRKTKLIITDIFIPNKDNLSSYNLPIAITAAAEKTKKNDKRLLNFIF
tara:strand:+ start:70 stop:261 length:192 start_codon:yes stop_codon:yes gene_type:complete